VPADSGDGDDGGCGCFGHGLMSLLAGDFEARLDRWRLGGNAGVPRFPFDALRLLRVSRNDTFSGGPVLYGRWLSEGAVAT
jgi:hypothetical protein